MALGPAIGIAPRTQLRIGPRLIQGVDLLSRRNSEVWGELARQAAVNPFLTLTGGADLLQAQARSGSLFRHVADHIALLRLSEPEHRVAMVFLEYLEPTGWLAVGLGDIARAARADMALCEAVLAALQRLDPAGIFCRTLAECLALQARDEGVLTAELVRVLSVLDAFETGGVDALAEAAGMPEAEAEVHLATIRRFDPKPGERFAESDPALFRAPDLIATRDGAEWRVRVNPTTRVEISVTACPQTAPARLRRQFAWAAALRAMVDTRERTLEAVGHAMVRHQSRWLLRDAECLDPLRRRDVAKAVDLHETTVGRVASAVMDTPRGTVALADLFSRPVGRAGWSADRVRARIDALIGAEDTAHPVSDTGLAAVLNAEGADITRRSVARWRAGLGHLPASRRRG